MRDPQHPRVGGVLALLATFLVIGVPLAAYLWGTLNELLAGRIVPVRLVIGVFVALAFAWLLRAMSQRIRRLEFLHDRSSGETIR